MSIRQRLVTLMTLLVITYIFLAGALIRSLIETEREIAQVDRSLQILLQGGLNPDLRIDW